MELRIAPLEFGCQFVMGVPLDDKPHEVKLG